MMQSSARSRKATDTGPTRRRGERIRDGCWVGNFSRFCALLREHSATLSLGRYRQKVRLETIRNLRERWMDRRTVITLLSGASVARPLRLHAQQPSAQHQMVWLGAGAMSAAPRVSGFLLGG